MRGKRLCLLTSLLIAGCGSGQIEPGQCGDGVVDTSEQCDDANLLDGDGCSASCQIEEDLGFSCVESFTADELYFGSEAMAASTVGTILVGGAITTEQRQAHGWIGAFDTQGEMLWTLDLEDGDFVQALRASGEGFRALVLGPEQSRVVEIDANGVLGVEMVLTTDARPHAMLETPEGLLLAGDIRPPTSSQPDLWLGRLGADGTIEVLVTEDHAELEDSFLAIEQVGDTIGLLGSVGLINRTDGDQIEDTIVGAMLIEYDQSLTETHRTLIADEDLRISWAPHDLVGVPGGRWIIVGHQPVLFVSRAGWATGIGDGEVTWSHVIEAPGFPAGLPNAELRGGAALQSAFLVGVLETEATHSQILLRVDPDSGATIGRADVVIDDEPYPTRLSTTIEDRGWFVGSKSTNSEKSGLWLCNVGL